MNNAVIAGHVGQEFQSRLPGFLFFYTLAVTLLLLLPGGNVRFQSRLPGFLFFYAIEKKGEVLHTEFSTDLFQSRLPGFLFFYLTREERVEITLMSRFNPACRDFCFSTPGYPNNGSGT